MTIKQTSLFDTDLKEDDQMVSSAPTHPRSEAFAPLAHIIRPEEFS